MLQEQYVSFETAKLLKEKGFDEKCHKVYLYDGTILWSDCFMEGESFVDYHDIELAANYDGWIVYTQGDYAFLCPTQQMAMQWLREHNIDIIPFHEILDGDVYWCRIEKKYGNLLHTELQQDPVYKTYEESVEEAIKYSLENLI